MQLRKKLKISGFFPFLNDWGTIGSLTTALDMVLKKICSDYEILIIDDGSSQSSKEILAALKKKFSCLRVITHPRNLGYGAAIKKGISQAKMDWIFYTDGDAQYDPRELQLLVTEITEFIDVVNGRKIKRADPWYRIIIGAIYRRSVRILFNLPISDVDCDFRLMRRRIFRKVKLTSNSGVICTEMIKKIADAGYKFAEVPVSHYWRTSGKSQFFNIRRVIRVIWDLTLLYKQLVIDKKTGNL